MTTEKKKSILLIDDTKEFCSLLSIMLSRLYKVVTACDGEEALEILDSGYTPDVIITDLIMPKIDGYQLISSLKQKDSCQNIPIIVLSNVEKPQKLLSLQRGISSYIIKPFDTKELIQGLGISLEKAFAQ